MGLCGVPLTMLCGNSEMSPPPPPAHSLQGDGSEFSTGIYWMVIMMGYGSGLIVGLVIGHTLTTRFHGAIENPTNLKFPKLRIIDLSLNGFSGTLPSEHFQNWNAMKEVGKGNSTYMQVRKPLFARLENLIISWNFTYSITISSKGTKLLYEKIQSVFVAVDVDLSDNKFNGKFQNPLEVSVDFNR
ncbi:hypothetical protein RHGRI_009837 [Rhododendron griersonianum]|uniref:Uncharacterized protein n=1 Tax=Rhododendron griersonianum TaxID=479676 RepID=A0AAV6KGY4_9ERIC|nr:hypothetical protein RHGRI_009837 [Rhododendron griersonianum]